MPCEPEQLPQAPPPSTVPSLDLPAGIPPLTSLYLYIAGSCNLACRHCWIEPELIEAGAPGKFLDFDLLKKAVIEAKPLGLQSVKLTGGEPMLHPRFREIVDFLDMEGLPITMETNGTLVDGDIARFLKTKPRFSFISVSLDGATSSTHEALRGIAGSFDRTVIGIRELAAAGFRPQLICTLHRGNVNEIDAIIDLAERLGCGSVKFNHIQNLGRGKLVQVTLSVKELIRIFFDLETKQQSRFNLPVFFDIPIAFHSLRRLLKAPLARCNIQNILGILADGTIALCGIGVTTQEFIFGHISQTDIPTIWTNHPKLKRLRIQIPFELEGICGECLHRDLCQGSCVANNFHRSGHITAENSFCREAMNTKLFPTTRKKIYN